MDKEETKQCRGENGCGEYKPLSEFSKNCSYCRSCRNEYQRNTREKEENKKRIKRWKFNQKKGIYIYAIPNSNNTYYFYTGKTGDSYESQGYFTGRLSTHVWNLGKGKVKKK